MNLFLNEVSFLPEGDVRTRSISAENPTGAKGEGGRADVPENERETHAARELGNGFKVRPSIPLEPGGTAELAHIAGSGAITHIWLTLSDNNFRNYILRMYWDDCPVPSVECPLGDFFFLGWDWYYPVNSACVAVNPGKGFNCFWPMPFRSSARITIENTGSCSACLFYQIDYQERKTPPSAGYFHAWFNRVNPLPYKRDYPILDGVSGRGKYVGTYVSYAPKSNGWWGEGEVKMFLDGDAGYPTYCGTGTEDYFLGAYNFEDVARHEYASHSGIYSGFYEVREQGLYRSQARFGMYRLHLADPICFCRDLRITMQSLGWSSNCRFHPQCDDIASVAYFYLDRPSPQKAALPDAEVLENR